MSNNFHIFLFLQYYQNFVEPPICFCGGVSYVRAAGWFEKKVGWCNGAQWADIKIDTRNYLFSKNASRQSLWYCCPHYPTNCCNVDKSLRCGALQSGVWHPLHWMHPDNVAFPGGCFLESCLWNCAATGSKLWDCQWWHCRGSRRTAFSMQNRTP